jgi:single-strand DNA-binding protein
MSGSINKAIIIGNLGKDPEIRATSDGREIANLTVATSERWKDKNSGEQRERAEWHKVSVFNEGLVNVCKRFLNKGSKVYIEGQIQTRKWTDKDGADRYSTEIVLQGFNATLVMLDGAKPDAHGEAKQNAYQPQADLDDSIPF